RRLPIHDRLGDRGRIADAGRDHERAARVEERARRRAGHRHRRPATTAAAAAPAAATTGATTAAAAATAAATTAATATTTAGQRQLALAIANVELLLNEVIAIAETHVGPAAVGRRVGGAEGPRALVGVLALRIGPRVQVGIRHGLLELVRQHRGHAVGADIAVRPRRIGRTARRALRTIADERVLDVAADDGAVLVPAAIAIAEAAHRDVRRGEHEVDGVGAGGQRARRQLLLHDRRDRRLADVRALRIVVTDRAGIMDVAGDVIAVRIVIDAVDIEILRPADARHEVGQDGRRAVAGPIAVPDEIDVWGAEHHRP